MPHAALEAAIQPKRIVVVGARGMLAQDLIPILERRKHRIVGVDREEMDITDRSATRQALRRFTPDLVIHCAAMTDVDGCESRQKEAFAINAQGTRHVALACQELDVPLVYISTDYVFDGRAERPYREIDSPNPQSAYGQSKLAGEVAVRELLRKFYIVRTAWLYGRHGKNFVDTMRKLAFERPELAVVADQFGSPTWTLPFCEALARLIESGSYGTYHMTGQGVTSWYEFARRILALSGSDTPVRPITTAELGRPAPRPAYSVLENLNLELAGIPLLPAWEESLAAYLATVPRGESRSSAPNRV